MTKAVADAFCNGSFIGFYFLDYFTCAQYNTGKDVIAMLEEKDLQAIAQMMHAMEQRMDQRMDQKLTDSEQRMTKNTETLIADSEQRMTKNLDQRLDQRFTEFEQRITKNTETLIAESEQRITKNTVMLMELEFAKNFKLLAEGQALILEKLVPSSRVEKLEDDVDVLKSAVRNLNNEVTQLKQAN